MKLKLISNKTLMMLFASVCIGSFTGCQPDTFEEGNSLSESALDAGFTVAPADAVGNRYTLEAAQGGGFLGSSWDLAGGISSSGAHDGVQEVFFPDAGTYEVKHITTGKGGTAFTSVQTIVVPTSDPNSGNLVVNGKFVGGPVDWTVLNISASGASVTFGADGASFIGTGYSQKAIYQPISVVAGTNYKIDMKVSGPGSINTWFEVYASADVPVQGSDYSAGGKRMGLSTWDGCATGPFSGQLSSVGCVGSGSVVTFPTTGTIYLLIKSGGDNIGGGAITATNVEFRKVN